MMLIIDGIKRYGRWILLTATLAVVAVAVMGARGGFLQWPLSKSGPEGGERASLVRVEMTIAGLDCVMCAAGLQNDLRRHSGVKYAEVQYQTKTAVIEYDPAITGPAQLAEAVRRNGFEMAH